MKPCTLFVTFLLTSLFCQAQTNSQSTVHTPSRGYVQPFDLNVYRDVATQREQAYQQNFQAINNQMQALIARIEDLNSVDSEAAAPIASSFNEYARKLSLGRIDWSQSSNYTIVSNAIRQFNSIINNAYANLRQARTASEAQFTEPRSINDENTNRVAETILYARISQKPDLGSAFIHSVEQNETVTVLGTVGTFYYVRCGKHEGYLSKGMIKRFVR